MEVKRPIKVLVVDDSFFMRTLMSDLLNKDPDIHVVASAKSGSELLDFIPAFKPDCIVLDILMPEMDGLHALKLLMKKFPTPTIILSGVSKMQEDMSYECLSHGALKYLIKPDPMYGIDSIRSALIEAVKAIKNPDFSTIWKNHLQKYSLSTFWPYSKKNVVVIGASTGGPESIEKILKALPADFPVPVLIAQHLPKDIYMHSFFKRLESQCWLKVKWAEQNESLNLGTAYCIPAGFNISLKAEQHNIVFNLEENSKSTFYSPNIDYLLSTAVNIYKSGTIGIILSGMGKDGALGMKLVKNIGGKTIVQDESAFMYGMPKAVIELGAADVIVSPEKIPNLLRQYCNYEQRI